MLDQVLLALHARGILDSPDPSRYTYVFSNRANINVLIFDRASGRRLLFVKLSDRGHLSAVFDTLEHVHRAVGCVPEPLCALRLDGFEAVVQRAHRMRVLGSRPWLGYRRRARVAESVISYLTDLHRQTRQGVVVLDRERLAETVYPDARRFFGLWNDTEGLRRFQGHLDGVVARRVVRIPQTPQHGDVGAFNTAVEPGRSGRVFIIDWDSYGAVTHAGLDVVTFVEAMARLYGRGLRVASPIGRRLARQVDAYAEAVGLEPTLIAELYPLYWLLYAGLREGTGIVSGQKRAYNQILRFLQAPGDLLLGSAA